MLLGDHVVLAHVAKPTMDRLGRQLPVARHVVQIERGEQRGLVGWPLVSLVVVFFVRGHGVGARVRVAISEALLAQVFGDALVEVIVASIAGDMTIDAEGDVHVAQVEVVVAKGFHLFRVLLVWRGARVEGAIDDLAYGAFERAAPGRIGRDDVHHPVGHVREDDDLEVLVECLVGFVAIEALLEVFLDEGVVF